MNLSRHRLQNIMQLYNRLQLYILMSEQANQDYENDYEQPEPQLEVIIEQKEPHEKVVSLAHESPSKENFNQFRSEQDDLEQKSKLIAKLKQVFRSKAEDIKTRKNNISDCKKQIKEIGEVVDKQMNKSILKHSKPHTSISIQSIFQNAKSSDPQIHHLNQELARVRAEAKKIKGELRVVQTQVKAPVNVMNFQRATQIKSKIKQIDTELKKATQDKDYLEAQLKMMQLEQAVGQTGNQQQVKNNKDKNINILNQLRQCKNSLYDFEKQDRVLTQKIRYIEELDSQVESRKSKSTAASIVPKQDYQIEIKQIVLQIKEVIEKRNKIQNDRKNTHKQLESDVSSLQAKNWDIINKLREIDAKLIKHYNSKLKKTKQKKEEVSTFEDPHKSREHLMPIQNSGATVKTLYVRAKNDKNMIPDNLQPEPVILVEKRKSYQFFMGVSQNQGLGNITLSDEMLGNKLSLKRLTFLIDETTLYGISADYENESKHEVRGYKIMSRIRPKDVISKSILVDGDKNQVINYIQVGVDNSDTIRFMHVITSQAKQFKWGNLQICDRNEQKNVRKYESITIKGKLNQISDKQAPNYYCLAGVGFSVVYLSPK